MDGKLRELIEQTIKAFQTSPRLEIHVGIDSDFAIKTYYLINEIEALERYIKNN